MIFLDFPIKVGKCKYLSWLSTTLTPIHSWIIFFFSVWHILIKRKLYIFQVDSLSRSIVMGLNKGDNATSSTISGSSEDNAIIFKNEICDRRSSPNFNPQELMRILSSISQARESFNTNNKSIG